PQARTPRPELSLPARAAGLGISRFVWIGTQAALEAAELVEALAQHEPTRLIAVYLEDFRDGRAFAGAAAGAGKPVVLLAGGQSEAGGCAAPPPTRAPVRGSGAGGAAGPPARVLGGSAPRGPVGPAPLLPRPPPPRPP